MRRLGFQTGVFIKKCLDLEVLQKNLKICSLINIVIILSGRGLYNNFFFYFLELQYGDAVKVEVTLENV